MNRWQNEFNNLNFISIFDGFINSNKKLSSEESLDQSIQEEILRINKAAFYLEKIIKNIDIDLVPRSLWHNHIQNIHNAKSEIDAYISNKNLQHLYNCNDNLDSFISSISQYSKFNSEGLNASLHKEIREQLNNLKIKILKDSKEVLSKSQKNNSDILEILKTAKDSENRIKSLEKEIFHDNDGSQSIEGRIRNHVEFITNKHIEVRSLHESLLVGENSLQTIINKTANEINSLKEKLTTSSESSLKLKNKLESFYERIYGKPSVEDPSKMEGGLESYLNKKQEDLISYEAAQIDKHQAIFNEIEKLLPGANSAGLAKAYSDMKKKFETPISNYTRIFYLSIFLLLSFSIFFAVNRISFFPFSMELVSPKNWDEMIRIFISRVPIIAPIVWLAVFAGTRRNQYERLYQEYAHKEALASSYMSYKYQIESLQSGSDELQNELIKKAIDAISFNASKTLDLKNKEKLPTSEIINDIGLEKLKKIKELLTSHD